MARTPDPRGWLDIAVGSALGLLVASLATYWAVHLIESVLLPLLIVLGVLFAGWVTIIKVRNRRGW